LLRWSSRGDNTAFLWLRFFPLQARDTDVFRQPALATDTRRPRTHRGGRGDRPAASAVGIARFAFLGWLLALVFRGAPLAALILPAALTASAVLLRGWLEHLRTMVANRTASRIQAVLRGQLYDKVTALGPAWFAGERTGGVMLSVVDGVEQLQTFFGQYLPQLCVSALTPLAIFAFMAWWTCRSPP